MLGHDARPAGEPQGSLVIWHKNLFDNASIHVYADPLVDGRYQEMGKARACG
jgi:hypothetical protein